MKPLATLFPVLLMAVHSLQIPMESLEDILVYPIEPTTNIRKRETSKNNQIDSSLADFIEEKLLQHSKALEHLVEMVRNNEELTKQLVGHLSKNVEKPKMPDKVEVHQNRRSYVLNEDVDNPIVRFGKSIRRYGSLFKNIILKEIKNDQEPTPLVEEEPVSHISEFMSRRSFGESPITVPSLQTNNVISQWCSVAILCHRTLDPVCGYDDNFGFGKFDDLCHMLQVNCYWKYNFALVPSCKPNL